MKKLVYAAMFLFAVACGNSESTERTDGFSKKSTAPEDILFDEVMHGHDTAMAKMGRISRYKKEVQSQLDSLSKIPGTAKKEIETALLDLQTDLKNAEDGMNKWMDEFDIDSAQDNISKRIDYLKDEKLRVNEVKEKIFNSLDKADSLLKR